MRRSILSFTLSLGIYFAFGQCGPYIVTAADSPSCQLILNVSGASAAQQIVWNLNGVFDTVHRGLIGETVAGGNGYGSAANQFADPWGVILDSSGNIYVADYTNFRIQKFPTGSTSSTNGVTVAGGNGYGNAPNQIAPISFYIDGSGNIYVGDANNNRIQMFPAGSTSATNGITVAGGSGSGSSMDSSHFNGPMGVYVDGYGNIYIADQQNNRVQKFPPGSTSGTNGITVAGGNGLGSAANQLFGPQGVHVDSLGNLYVCDAHNNRIQKFPPGSTSATNGVTIAGGIVSGSAANQLSFPQGFFFDNSGYMYVADEDNERIQKFPPGSTYGITVAGGNGFSNTASGFEGPKSVYVDGSGNIYVSDESNFRIQKWGPTIIGIDTTKIFTPSAGSYSATVTDSAGCIASSNNVIIPDIVLSSFSPTSAIKGDTVTILGQYLSAVSYVTFGGTSASFVSALNDSTVIAVVGAGSSGTIQVANSCFSDTLVGFTYPGTGGQCGPYTITTADSSCTSFMLTISGASATGQIVWQKNGAPFDTVGPIITTVAGGNGAGSAANQLNTPFGVFLDASGNIYVGDFSNNRVQKFPAGSTSATNGVTVAGGNGQGSTANQLYWPWGVCVDGPGNLYVADYGNRRIQKFPASSTSATNGTTIGSYQINSTLLDMCVDAFGNIYVADEWDNVILKFPAGSTASTIGTTVTAGLNAPYAVNVDVSGNIYVADEGNNRIQEFPVGSTSASYGTTVAAYPLSNPQGVYVDSSGNIYVADNADNCIQKFPASSNSSTIGITVAGGNGPGSAANQLNGPTGVYVDGSGNIYIADAGNNRIQKWSQKIGADTTILVTSVGNYSAMVTDTAGCIAQSDTISAHPGVNAYFTLQPSGTPHLWYIVNQCHGPGALTYVWNWGDSTSSTGDTPSHTYSTAGYYNVCVTATSSMGCSASYCDSDVYLFKDQAGQIVNAKVVYQIPNGISEINTQSPIRLYPNPNKGSFTLETSGSIGSDYIISDMLGNVIIQQAIRSDKQVIELPAAAEGVYTLVIKGAQPIRFVIVR